MTLVEATMIELKKSNVEEATEGFTKAFRINELGNIVAGDEFEIPADYKVLRQRVMRGGEPVMALNLKTGQREPVCAEYIQCQTKGGRIVNFYPSSLTKVAFRVNPETGKDVTGPTRIVRTKGDLVDWVQRYHPEDMNKTMKALVGCTVKCAELDPVPVREFGVKDAQATKDNVTINNVGTWTLTGEKRPENWTV